MILTLAPPKVSKSPRKTNLVKGKFGKGVKIQNNKSTNYLIRGEIKMKMKKSDVPEANP